MPTDKQPDRREFLKGVGLAAGGAALGANPENLFAAPRSVSYTHLRAHETDSLSRMPSSA